MNSRVVGQLMGNAIPARYTSSGMANAVTGTLKGTIITLDAPVPPLDGHRVRVVVEQADEEMFPSPEENAKHWAAWIAHGPQGPIEIEGDDHFPDDE
jgi:hypothetical protein